MRSRTAVFALLVALSASAWAQNTKVEKVSITKYGIYDQETIAAADPATGKQVNQARMHLVEQTTTIPGKVGLSFGIWYLPIGEPEGAADKGLLIVRVPDKGVLFGGKRVNEVKLPLDLTVNSESSFGYTIDPATGVLPGVWRFEIWVRDVKMAEQQFTVE